MAETDQDPNDDSTEEPIEEAVQAPAFLDDAEGEAEEPEPKKKKPLNALLVKPVRPRGWQPLRTWQPCSWRSSCSFSLYRDGRSFNHQNA